VVKARNSRGGLLSRAGIECRLTRPDRLDFNHPGVNGARIVQPPKVYVSFDLGRSTGPIGLL
jgi:hypothetical protein